MLAADCICLGGVCLSDLPPSGLAAVLAPKDDLEFSDPMELVRAMECTLCRFGIFCSATGPLLISSSSHKHNTDRVTGRPVFNLNSSFHQDSIPSNKHFAHIASGLHV